MDPEGNFICINIATTAGVFNLLTLYGPNNDVPCFFTKIKVILLKEKADYNILCGDFNVALDPLIDTHNYKRVNNPRTRTSLLGIKADLDLIDIYREFYPNTKRYTWRKHNPLKQARLDYFLVSNTLSDIVPRCSIKPGYRSDHSIIMMEFELNKFKMGKGIWKMNNSLLKNSEYLKTINNAIPEEIIKNTIPVYDMNF